MTNKEFVISMYPSARCITSEEFDQENNCFLLFTIFARDDQNREYVLSLSVLSEEDAWEKIVKSFQQKMLAKLEKEEVCHTNNS